MTIDQNSGPGSRKNLKEAFRGGTSPALAAWIAVLFLGSILGAFLSTSVVLALEGKEGALLIALIAGVALWAVEVFESKRPTSFTVPRDPGSRSIAAMGFIILVAVLTCLPTLNVYFLVDEFGFIHAFHLLSPAQFLQLLQMDMGQFVWGNSRQEFRPLFSLFYVAAYHLWGLRPWGYHLCEISLHAIVSVQVFLIAKALAPGDARRGTFAGLLFAVQPFQAQTTSLIVGFAAEILPAFFYLFAFLYFVRFRSSGRLQQLAVSLGAFTAGLLTKESAVTLPAMLVTYDLFRSVIGEDVHSYPEGYRRWERWRKLVLPYAPYCILLLTYLAWRQRVFASFLREANWGTHADEAAASPGGFWLHLTHVASRIWQLQAFNLDTLFPYSVLVIGVVLGLLLVWTISLYRQRQECGRSLTLVLYFGLVWYLISEVPYVIEGHVAYHMYLPAVGGCIGVACLAFPICRNPEKARQYSRLLGVTLLVLISATRMWKGDAEFKRLGKVSARMADQLAVGLKDIPKNELVIIWPGKNELIDSGWGEEILPFSVQPPFTVTDLYSNVRVVEHPYMSCCGVGEWWQKISPMLCGGLARPPGDEVVVYLLWWNESTGTFHRTTRMMPRKLLIDSATAVLGGPPEAIESVDDDTAIRLVKALAELVGEGELVSKRE